LREILQFLQGFKQGRIQHLSKGVAQKKFYSAEKKFFDFCLLIEKKTILFYPVGEIFSFFLPCKGKNFTFSAPVGKKFAIFSHW
jgi:hypothetical protein